MFLTSRNGCCVAKMSTNAHCAELEEPVGGTTSSLAPEACLTLEQTFPASWSLCAQVHYSVCASHLVPARRGGIWGERSGDR